MFMIWDQREPANYWHVDHWRHLMDSIAKLPLQDGEYLIYDGSN